MSEGEAPGISATEQELAKLQKGAENRFGSGWSLLKRLVEKKSRDTNLLLLSETVLKKLKTEVETEGKLNPTNTIIVANHPSWILDPFVLTTACNKVDNLKIFSRDEPLAIMPQNLRHHIIPVSIYHSLNRHKDELGKNINTVKAINRLFPSADKKTTSESNRKALEIAARHVIAGGNVAIFEPQVAGRSFQEFMEYSQNPENKWPQGVGFVIRNILETSNNPLDCFVQPVSIEYIKGDRNKLLSPKQVRVKFADPINLIKVRESGKLPSQLTSQTQKLYINSFS